MKNLRHIRTLFTELSWVIRSAADLRSAWTLSVDLLLHRLMKFWPEVSTNRIRLINVRGGTHVFYRLNKADRRLLQEIWMERAYRIPSLKHGEILVDIGANIGLTSLWLAKEYGFSKLIAVEPSPENAAVLERNLAANNIAFHIIQGAAGSRDGFAIFDPGPSPTNGRLVSNADDTSPDTGPPFKHMTTRRVSVFCMDTILETLSADSFIDLLKIDIEGGEQEVFTGNLDWLHRIRALVIEFHPGLANVSLLRKNILQWGFKSVRTIETGDDFMEVFIKATV